MGYEVYRHKYATNEAFNLISIMYKRIMSEDKYLCIHTQKDLNTGVFVNDLLYFQKTGCHIVIEHRKKEEDVGHEIWPAAEPTTHDTSVSEEPFAFCTGTEAYMSERNDLNVTVAPMVSV